MANKQKLELTWIGKDTPIKVEPRILVHDPTKDYGDKTTDNMLIYGDNLLALKALEQDYAGKIKCIYIDPPYNTGSAFEHYDDNLEHSTWLSLMKPRLELLRNLLTDDGVIFVQIDDEEQAYLKLLMDEIFGRKNFMTMLTIETGEVFGTKAAHIYKTFVKVKDYIFVYKKNEYAEILFEPLYTKTNEPFDPHYSTYIDPDSLNKEPLLSFLKKQQWVVDIFQSLNYKLQLDNISKVMSQNQKFNNYIISDLAKNIYQDQPLSRQVKEAESIKPGEMINFNGSFVFKTSTGSIRYYMPFSEALHWTSDFIPEYCRSTARGNLWKNYHLDMRNVGDEGNVKFKNSKKPERLIKDILTSCTQKNDFILDSFLGSGTTAAVAHKMGRKYIGIELGEHCHTHCIPRLQKVIDGTDQGGISKAVNWHGGGGFKYYYLAPSLLNKDKYGQYVISKEYNADMLAAAVAKNEGFKYAPSQEQFWKQGQSSEADFIYTTTNHVGAELLSAIAQDMKPGESLLICCKSFDSGLSSRFANITVKKIPAALLGRCEFGKDNYNLNIINPPVLEEEEE